MKKILIICLVILVAISLFGEVKIVENKMNPKVDSYSLKLTKTIELGDEAGLVQDYLILDNRIILCDMQSKMILIYSMDGETVKILDTVGNGPGELSMPTNSFDDEKNNRFGIVDQMNRRTSYFTYDGEYIEDVNFDNMEVPMRIHYDGDYVIDFFMGIEFNRDTGEILSKPTIRSRKGEEQAILFTDSFNPLEMNVGGDYFPVYVIENGLLYISKLNPEDYVIDVKSLAGEDIMQIRKKYKKTKRSEEDIAEIEERLEEVKKQIENTAVDFKMDFTGYEYANAINAVLSNEGNIWVFTQDKEDMMFDIIDKSGKIIAQCKPEKSMYQPRFHNGYLYDLHGDEDSGYSIEKYEVIR